MDSRLEKYYDGRSCDIGLDRSSAIAAFAALLNGNTHGGDLFKMHDDSFMQKNLYPEDFDYWMTEKKEALSV